MQLDGSYEFLEMTQTDGILVSNALEKGTGKRVQLHLFPAERSQDADQICQSIMGLPDAARRMIIKFGKDGTSTYFVTEPLPQGEGLRNWIAGKAAHGARPENPPTPAAPPAPAKGGDSGFTAFYTQDDVRRATANPVGAPAPLPVQEAKPVGDFTRIYGAHEMRGLDPSGRQSVPAPEVRPMPSAPPREATPPPAPARESTPGLETFIFAKNSVTIPAPPRTPSTPTPPLSPPTPQPVFDSAPIEPPVERGGRRDTFESPQTIYAPPPTPAPAAGAPRPALPPNIHARVETPRSPAIRFDWKVAVFAAVGLLIVAAMVIAIVG